jgi:hypothetical protein
MRPHSTRRSANNRRLQRSRPAGGGRQASATRWASWRPFSVRRLPGRGRSYRAASRPAVRNRLHVWVRVTAEVCNIAAMVCFGCRSSVKSSVCAQRTARAGALPFWMSA